MYKKIIVNGVKEYFSKPRNKYLPTNSASKLLEVLNFLSIIYFPLLRPSDNFAANTKGHKFCGSVAVENPHGPKCKNAAIVIEQFTE
jgi:hypothetical protein